MKSSPSRAWPIRLRRRLGEERHVAILFADIRGFTAFAERLLPYDVIHALNRYYRQVGRIIHRHGGVIDNYMGDGILTIFGLDGNRSRRVARASGGAGMLEAVEAMKPYFHALHGRSFDIGIGLHYGAVIAAASGGETTNGARLSATRLILPAGSRRRTKPSEPTFLSRKTRIDRAGHEVEVNQCPPWEIRGKTGVYQLYEVVGAKAI